MTEGKKIGQWIVGMVLLFLFLVTAFIPWITLSGNDYVDAAVNVHEYARKQDAVTADAAGQAMETVGVHVPLMLSVTVSDILPDYRPLQ